MQWYYAIGGERRGPVEIAELRKLMQDGQVKTEDLVWNEAMGEKWLKAGDMEELLDNTPGTAAKHVRNTAPACVSPLHHIHLSNLGMTPSF
jgi:hypothetical protein